VKEWKLNDELIPDVKTNSFELTLTESVTVTVEFELTPLIISTSDLPNGVVGELYNSSLSSTSEIPVNWKMGSGGLPNGLELSKDGRILGIPIKAATFNFTVIVENGMGTGSKQLTIMVGKGVGAAVTTPAAQTKTFNSITLSVVSAPTNDQMVEYAMSETNDAYPESLTWQDGVTFYGLTAYAGYFAYARSKENSNYFAGAASVSEAMIADETDVSEEIPLKAHVQGGRLHVSGLIEGKQWSLYSVSGKVEYRNIATNDSEDISLNAQGVFIVESEGRTVKVAFYGQ
jgi:hypothetical protein